ncbi:hypothetical protein OG746_08385 [Streptomyces sp. NBC_01016]|uniref:hypothetical protein n=1 Tax=Streptomyces sp. NBC_01016 TaxID=2903720 RepID=UPI00224E9048|nr:hypothetical protein [Streptomyces sp. NBC_01016]MCX4828741.1 hypothetical protein [Streptomyces sp. NBC_01016]
MVESPFESLCVEVDLHINALKGALIQRHVLCSFSCAESEDTCIEAIEKGVASTEKGHVPFLALLQEPLLMDCQTLITNLPAPRLVGQKTAK